MRIFQYIVCAGILFLVSCTKELQVKEAPDFDVQLEASSYKAGEEVVFKMSGHADMISFYPGTVLNDYTYRDGRVVELTVQGAVLSFTSAVTAGTQANQLSVLVSTNFNGDYSSLASVRAATWTDITSRFTLGTSATFVESKKVDISDLVVQEAPVYVAFRYHTKPQATNGVARNWMIQTFVLSSKTPFNGTNLPITDQATAGFSIVDQDPANTPARSVVTATRVSLLGNLFKQPSDPIYNPENPIYDPENPIYKPGNPAYNPDAVRPVYVPYDPASPYNDPEREHWAISRALHTDKVNLGPDISIPLRGVRNDSLEEYRHVYSQPGTYKAYFVASNTTLNDEKTVVKEVTVTIVQ